METAMPMAEPGFVSAGFTRKLVQAWVNSCNDFLQWQHRELIDQKPSPEKLSEHRNTLKLMLRLGRSFHAQVSDPDFPLRLIATEVAGKLHQLEKSWEMIQDPMKDSEADAILQQAFPDEPGTGSAA